MFSFFRKLIAKNDPKVEIQVEIYPDIPYVPKDAIRDPVHSTCPSCGCILEKPVKRKTKCKACGEYIYVRTGEDRVRTYLTEAEKNKYEQIDRISNWFYTAENLGSPFTEKQKEFFIENEDAFIKEMEKIIQGNIDYHVRKMKYEPYIHHHLSIGSLYFSLHVLYSNSPITSGSYDGRYNAESEKWNKMKSTE